MWVGDPTKGKEEPNISAIQKADIVPDSLFPSFSHGEGPIVLRKTNGAMARCQAYALNFQKK